ncbi:uncharacterized protein LOC143605542 [Bidens hawaiensis]|uniref:uncharacterized protein LOC143605542 n=1 Tax=Bidens hawaiensis TaxID=980011 RepID=UPI004049D161
MFSLTFRLQNVLSKPELSGRLAKWAIELGEHAIEYKPRPAIKGKVLTDFIAEIPQEKEEECKREVKAPVDRQKDEVWKLFTDGASNDEGAGAGLRITNPEGQQFTYVIRLEFKSTNNEAEYEALLAGLRIAKKLGARRLEAHVDSMLVANQIEGSYDAKDDKMASYLAQAKVLMAAFTTCKVIVLGSTSQMRRPTRRKLSVKRNPRRNMWSTCRPKNGGRQNHEHKVLLAGMHVDAEKELRRCSACQRHAPNTLRPKNAMIPVTTSWPFQKWAIDITGPFPEAPGRVMFLIVAIDYFTKWVEAKPVASINAASANKFIWEFITCRFGLPMNLVSDYGTQFADQHIQRWLKELNVTQTFTSVAHPQGNGEVERANRTIVGGIKKRLANHKSGWVDQLPHVLWAIRTHKNTSNAETPFSLTYGTEAMIPAEVGVPSPRVTLSNDNDAERRLDLMLLEERQELAAIREQNYKR